jgi:hypothetical protein
MLQNFLRADLHKWIAVAGLLLGLFTVILYVISTSVVVLICQENVYSNLYTACADRYEKIFTYTTILLGLMAFIYLIPYTVRTIKNKKELRNVFVGYMTFVVIVLLPLSVMDFCLGFLGCASMAPFALGLGVVVLVVSIVVRVIVDLLWKPKNANNKFKIFFATTILLVVATFYVLDAPDKLRKSDFILNYDLDDKALKMKDMGVCSRTFVHRHKDDCISSFAIKSEDINYCEAINAADIKEKCIAFVVRNKAIDTLDIELCNQITLPSQLSICKLRINEALARER